MGCFSSVCVISKLPIYECPIVGIPILKNKYTGSRVACYPGTDWELDGFPIFGENDSYGRIDQFEKGKYHKLNIARYKGMKSADDFRKDIKDNFMRLITDWSQPTGNQSIMYIHLPVWEYLMKHWRKAAESLYNEEMGYAREDDASNAKIYSEIMKSKESKKVKNAIQKYKNSVERISTSTKIPWFRGDSLGISFDLIKWCNKNYEDLMRDAIIDLIALSISCTFTHSLFMPTYTVGEQMSGWKEETEFHQFVADIAKKELRRIKRFPDYSA